MYKRQALDSLPLAAAQRAELLDLRAENSITRGQTTAAEADAQALDQLARQHRRDVAVQEMCIRDSSVGRAEVGLFSAQEVTLLQTFARQAVVAIENVRLFNETRCV